MPKWAALIAMSVLFVSLIDGAFGAASKLVVLAQKSASGKNAQAFALAKMDKYEDLQIHVKAKPNQRVKAGYVMYCDAGGFVSRGSRTVRGRTPLSVPVVVDPNAECRVGGDATLSKRGRVTVQVLTRR
jgi:hypothetical protein